MTKSEIIEKLKPRCNGYDLPLSLNLDLVAEILTEPSVGENAGLPRVSNPVCPKCGCTDYEEWEELEYEKGGDDSMYGGALIPIKFTRCGECD